MDEVQPGWTVQISQTSIPANYHEIPPGARLLLQEKTNCQSPRKGGFARIRKSETHPLADEDHDGLRDQLFSGSPCTLGQTP